MAKKPITRKAADPVAMVVLTTAMAAILLLLSTFSMPFNKSVYLLRLKATASGIRRYVDFGAFGYCIVPVGMEKNKLGFIGYPNCTSPTFGWKIGKDITDVLQVPSALQSSLPKTMTSFLILGPIALGLTFITLLVTLRIYVPRTIARRTAREVPANPLHFKILFFIVVLAMLGAALAVIADIVVLVRMKERVSFLTSQTSNLKSSRGDVILLDGIAWFLLILAVFVANRLRRVGIKSEDVAEPHTQTTPIAAYEMSNTPQNNDPPPSYIADPSSNTITTPEPIIITQGRRRFNLFRFGNNVSYV